MNSKLPKIQSYLDNPLITLVLVSFLFALLGFLFIQINTCRVAGFINSSRGGVPKHSLICKIL